MAGKTQCQNGLANHAYRDQCDCYVCEEERTCVKSSVMWPNILNRNYGFPSAVADSWKLHNTVDFSLLQKYCSFFKACLCNMNTKRRQEWQKTYVVCVGGEGGVGSFIHLRHRYIWKIFVLRIISGRPTTGLERIDVPFNLDRVLTLLTYCIRWSYYTSYHRLVFLPPGCKEFRHTQYTLTD